MVDSMEITLDVITEDQMNQSNRIYIDSLISSMEQLYSKYYTRRHFPKENIHVILTIFEWICIAANFLKLSSTCITLNMHQSLNIIHDIIANTSILNTYNKCGYIHHIITTMNQCSRMDVSMYTHTFTYGYAIWRVIRKKKGKSNHRAAVHHQYWSTPRQCQCVLIK